MKTIMRGNKQLSVDESRLSDFLSAGYVEVDSETGLPVSVPDDEDKAESALKKKNAELKKANEKLAKENEELTARVAELEAAAPSAKA